MRRNRVRPTSLIWRLMLSGAFCASAVTVRLSDGHGVVAAGFATGWSHYPEASGMLTQSRLADLTTGISANYAEAAIIPAGAYGIDVSRFAADAVTTSTVITGTSTFSPTATIAVSTTPSSTLTPTPVPSSSPMSQQAIQQTVSSVLRLAGGSILMIQVQPKGHAARFGTGFVVRDDPSGTYVATSAGLLQGATPSQVHLASPGSRTSYVAQLMLLETRKPGRVATLAVIRMQPTTLRGLSYGSSARLALGDLLVSVDSGIGKGGMPAADLSVISSLHRDLHDGIGPSWIQHATILSTTAVGGPLLDLKGNLEGVNLVAFGPGKGATQISVTDRAQLLALPSALVHPIVSGLIAGIIGKRITQTVPAPATLTPVATFTPTSTATATETSTATDTATATNTASPTVTSTATLSSTLTASATPSPTIVPTAPGNTNFNGNGYTASIPASWNVLRINNNPPIFLSPNNDVEVDIGVRAFSGPASSSDIQAGIGTLAGSLGGASCSQYSVTFQPIAIGRLSGVDGTLTCTDAKRAQIAIAYDGASLIVAIIFYTTASLPSNVQEGLGIVSSISTSGVGGSGTV